VVNVRHGGLVLETGHQATGANRALLDVVVGLLSVPVLQPIVFQLGEFHQVHEQINLGLGAHEHGLHRRAAEAGQVYGRGQVPLLLEHELVVCNNGRDTTLLAL